MMDTQPVDVAGLLRNLVDAKSATDIFEKKEPLAEKELDFLVGKWLSVQEGQPLDAIVKTLAKYRSYPQACGCMGSRDGEPWCPCLVWGHMEDYRFDVAIRLLDTRKEHGFD